MPHFRITAYRPNGGERYHAYDSEYREDFASSREQAVRIAADLIVRDFDADYIEVLEDTQGEDYDAPQTYLKIECKEEIQALAKTIADRLAAEKAEKLRQEQARQRADVEATERALFEALKQKFGT